MSARRFIEIFDREVGLTPKLFARVRRLQEVLRRLEDGACVDWAETALAQGYFDQAHMIRDFKEFTGLAPKAYPGAARPEREPPRAASSAIGWIGAVSSA